MLKCHNIMKHKTSLVFDTVKDWKKHAADCYGEGKVPVLTLARIK